MKKKATMILSFVLALSMVSCGSAPALGIGDKSQPIVGSADMPNNNNPQSVGTPAIPEDSAIMKAKIVEIKNNRLIVEPVEGSAELNSSDQFSVPIEHMDASPEPQVGNVVEVFYDGGIEEIYPAMLETVYFVRVVETEKTQDALNESETNIELVNIVDLTVVNQVSTDSAMEEFCKDNDYTYYFPSIKSKYIECQFSNGDKMTIVEALNSGKVTISDLDTYDIFYWKVDKNGTYIKSSNKQKPGIVEQSSFVWKVKDIETGIGPVTLSEEESKKVKDIISGCKYEIGTADCANDFQFIRDDGSIIYYHSECGTFNDIENNQSYRLLDEQKEWIGTLLAKYLVVHYRTPNQEYQEPDTTEICEGVPLAPEGFTKP